MEYAVVDEVASLKVSVDSTSVKAARADMDAFTASGVRTQGVLSTMQRDMDKLAVSGRGVRSALNQMQQDMNKLAKTSLPDLASTGNWKKTLQDRVAASRTYYAQLAAQEETGEAEISSIDRLAQLAREGSWKATLANRLRLNKQYFAELTEQEAAGAQAAAAAQRSAAVAAMPGFGAGIIPPISGNYSAAATSKISDEEVAARKAAAAGQQFAKDSAAAAAAVASLGDLSGLSAGKIKGMIAQLGAMGTTKPQIVAMKAALEGQLGALTTTTKATGGLAAAAKTATAMQAGFRLEALASGRAVTEYGALLAEGLRGNYTRLLGTTATLANRTGLLRLAFSGTGAIIAGIVAALGIFITAQIKAANYTDALNKSLLLTGRAAQSSADALQMYADAAQGKGESLSTAKDAAKSVAAIGAFDPRQYQMLIQAVTDLSTLSGEATDKSAELFLKLQQGSKGAIEEAQQQYHMLTNAQQDQIDSLEKLGDAYAAGQIAVKALADAVHQRTADVGKDSGTLITWAHDIGYAWNNMMRTLGNVGRPNTLANAADDALHTLTVARQEFDSWAKEAPKSLGATLARRELTKALSDYQDAVAKLAASNAPKNAAAAQQAAADASRRATLAWNDDSEALDKNAKKQAELNKLKYDATQLVKNNAAEAKKEGITLDAQGNPQGGTYARNVTDTLKKYAIKPDPGIKAQANEYEELIAKIQDYKDNLQQELDTNKKVSDFEKYSINVKNQLAKAGDKLNDAQRKKILADLASVKPLNDSVQAQRASIKADQEAKTAKDDLARTLERLKIENQDYAANAAANLKYYTSSGQQLEELQDLGNAQTRFDRADIQAKQDLGSANQKVHDAAVDFLNQESDLRQQAIDQVHEYYKNLTTEEGSWALGAKKALISIQEEGQNVAGATQDFVTGAFGKMTDALTTFVTTGKLNFKSLISSILADLAQMAIKIAASKLITAILGALLGSGVGNAGSGVSVDLDTGGAGTYASYAANGRAYGAQGEITAFATGGVVSRPTAFAYAGGGRGVMGEAGDEGILPLTRVNGKLGVNASGMSGGGLNIGSINITTIVDNKGATKQGASNDDASKAGAKLAALIKAQVLQVIKDQQRPGGVLWSAA
jgi:lambda family phage tail tape measure protein